jgi:hypothetical protein
VTNSILDLVSIWEPHKEFPELRQFMTRYELQGYAHEDGKTLQIYSAFGTEPAGPKLQTFMIMAKQVFEVVIVNKPFGATWVTWLMENGFCSCSARMGHKETWCRALAWNRAAPKGSHTAKPEPGDRSLRLRMRKWGIPK